MRCHVAFTVPFVKGWHRARARKVGRSIQYYSCSQDRTNKDAIRRAYECAAANVDGPTKAPAGTPVRVAIASDRDVLSAFRKRDGDSHPDTQKPDADNVAKLVLDALNGVAWEDDQQVNDLHIVKNDRTRGKDASMLITIEWKDEEE